MSIPSSCDYVVVGAGATGMAFCDSLLEGLQETANEDKNKNKNRNNNEIDQTRRSILLLDQHDAPGGQWHDSYGFVRLHQPSKGYGVESTPLEPSRKESPWHRATRLEILQYYQTLLESWETAADVDFQFIGNATFDFTSKRLGTEVGEDKTVVSYQFTTKEGNVHSVAIRQKLVDARYLQPDLPVTVPPKFTFDPNHIHCVPVNDLNRSSKDDSFPTTKTRFCVIGAGKTGMDAVYYLLQDRNIPPSQIAWVAPHSPWITAREKIGSCMEFLHDVAVNAQQQQQQHKEKSSADFPSLSQALQSSCTVQTTFLQWERQGMIYRLFPDGNADALPTKFQDATLSREELHVLRQIPNSNVIRSRGRVQAISDGGDLVMQNGETVELPWKKNGESASTTTYVHCTAGAFNYTRQVGHQYVPVFDEHHIVIQDVYGTPGFCFVGSLIGKLESLPHLTDVQKNAMCRAPKPTPSSVSPLGPSGGDVTGLSPQHGYVQRLLNLRDWLRTPELRDWLVGHRLFNMGHHASAEEIEEVVDETYNILRKGQIVA